jgi:hypothetical protein
MIAITLLFVQPVWLFQSPRQLEASPWLGERRPCWIESSEYRLSNGIPQPNKISAITKKVLRLEPKEAVVIKTACG